MVLQMGGFKNCKGEGGDWVADNGPGYVIISVYGWYQFVKYHDDINRVYLSKPKIGNDCIAELVTLI